MSTRKLVRKKEGREQSEKHQQLFQIEREEPVSMRVTTGHGWQRFPRTAQSVQHTLQLKITKQTPGKSVHRNQKQEATRHTSVAHATAQELVTKRNSPAVLHVAGELQSAECESFGFEG